MVRLDCTQCMHHIIVGQNLITLVLDLGQLVMLGADQISGVHRLCSMRTQSHVGHHAISSIPLKLRSQSLRHLNLTLMYFRLVKAVSLQGLSQTGLPQMRQQWTRLHQIALHLPGLHQEASSLPELCLIRLHQAWQDQAGLPRTALHLPGLDQKALYPLNQLPAVPTRAPQGALP